MNFSNYPESLGELRGDRDASTWTAREAMINVLRLIDRGEINPTTLIVGWTDGKDAESRCFGSSLIELVGLLERLKLVHVRAVER